MKRVYVNEEWCLGCHLCEYNCAFANSGMTDMATALKGKPIYPRIHIEGNDKVSYAVSVSAFVGVKDTLYFLLFTLVLIYIKML